MPGPMNNISSRLVPYWCAPGARSVRDLPEDEHGPAPRPPRKSQSHRSLRRVFSQASISSFATTQPATDSVPPVPPLPSLPIVDLSQAPPNAAYAVYTIGPNGVPTLTYAQAPPNGIPMTPTGYTPPPSAPPTTTYMPMGSTASFAHAPAPTLAPPPVVAAPQVIPATQPVISLPTTPAPQQIVAPSVAPNAPVNPPTIATQAPTPTSASPSTPTAPVRKPYKLPEPFLPRSMGGSDRGYRGLPAGLPMMSDHKPITQVDPVDASTPDKWINRNPDLVRHTGKHPINAEVRLEKLFDSGFLTPSEQFYIRSHGGVPQVTVPAADWQVKIHGLVDKEISLSIRELSELFPVVTLPVTVVCAGNRRKEQMIIQKGIGFNWGPAAVSTALFTGVYLADILEYVGVKKGAKHVIFEGADALPNGNYGTSQYLSWCKNKSKGIMVAWLMNGLPLEPDHGFPLRAVTPGHVGGRFVKWLHRIEVSVESSNHHLHHFDNKLLPTQLSAEVARAENHWWYEEKYIINELNVNSVIARPQHDETITFHSSRLSPSNGDSLIYALEGYAYSGGGRRITRVEISLDHGDTWRLAEINYPEDKFRDICHNDPVYGTLDLTESETSYAWCFWKFNVPVRELANSHVVCVRAMDAALATQPRDMYWNASCMMNNWWFRVAIHKEVADDKVTIRFEHPTLAGPTPGGWMERMKNAGLDPRKPIFGPNEIQAAPAATSAAPAPAAAASSGAPAMTADGKPSMLNPAITREITMEEVQAQPKDKPWFIVDNEVYDGTGFLEEHPGGADSILLVAGEDASEDFHAIHSNDGRLKMIPFHIGHLVKEKGKAGNAAPAPSIAPAMTPAAAPIQAVVKSSGPPFLNPRQWKPTKVTKITRVSHDSSVFRFALESGDQDLGLPCGQHVFIRLRRKDTGELVQRAYTPLSDPHIKGYIDILIKVYLPSPEFPAGGKMTMGFNDLVVGDSVDMKGPLGSFIWTGPGSARWKNAPIKLKNIGLISAGSGITPIMQILRAVLNDPNDTQTKLWLLDANKTEQDILCREDIDTFHEYHPDRLKVHHTLSRPTTQNIGFSTGRINDAMMAAHLPPPGPDSYILICGPDPLIKQTVEPGLRRLGWDTSRTFVIF